MAYAAANTDGNDRDEPGDFLRSARERAGLTRAQLAGLTGCAVSSLGFIEQGAVPKRSDVLRRAFKAIERVEAERSNPTP